MSERRPTWHGLRGRHVMVFLALAGCLTLAGGAPAHVLVKSGEWGQGLLFRRADTCYLATADHVLKGRRAANVVATGVAQRLGEARLVVRFKEQDLALLRVVGGATSECGDDMESYRADLGRLLNHRDTATLPVVNDVGERGADGGMNRVPLVVVDIGPEFLRVEAVGIAPETTQGVSGALIVVAGRPAGLITKFEGSIGKVIRLDRAMQSIAEFFNHPQRFQTEALPMGPTGTAWAVPAEADNLLSFAAGATVVRWSHEPLAPERLTSNILDPGAVASWGASPKSWPVEMDFRLAGGRAATISRLEFVRAEDMPAAAGAREVEVLVSSDGGAWWSVYLGTLFADVPSKVVEFAPVRATLVRLRIYENWGDAGAVSLRRMRAFSK